MTADELRNAIDDLRARIQGGERGLREELRELSEQLEELEDSERQQD